MVYFFTPYNLNKNLFEAYDTYANLIQNDEDWLCFMDGDTLFFQSNFGHLIDNATRQVPHAGLITCYASRIKTQAQVYSDKLYNCDSIKTHFDIAKALEIRNHENLSLLDTNIAGFMMVIRKATWLIIRNEVKEKCYNMKMLGVDYAISEAIRNHNFKTYRMNDLYMLHYYRMVEGNAQNRGVV